MILSPLGQQPFASSLNLSSRSSRTLNFPRIPTIPLIRRLPVWVLVLIDGIIRYG